MSAPPFVEIAVPVPVPGALTYRLPPTLTPWVRPGQRVRVPLGRRSAVGVVWAFAEHPPDGVEPRSVERLLDLEPALTSDLLELARFTADYYLAPLGEVLAAMLPQDLPPWGDRAVTLTAAGALGPLRDDLDARLRDALIESGRLRLGELLTRIPDFALAERVEAWIQEQRLRDLGAEARGRSYVSAFHLAPGEVDELLLRCGRSVAGRRVVEFLAREERVVALDEVRAATEVGDSVLNRLVRLGVLQRFRQPERQDLGRHLLRGSEAPAREIVLQDDQQSALAALVEAVSTRQFSRFLLQGVTGSGKTEVYLRAAQATLEQGRSTVVLVPEIALVPALARAAKDRFGDRLAVLHSALGRSERNQEWNRIRSGEARVVVGPRSALFAPLVDLGLIVVDEEQDGAYKQETTPRYHGRDLALVRGRSTSATVLLVSATPSAEARYAVERGAVRRLSLRRRIGTARLPEGILVDLRSEPKIGRPGELLFSERLLQEIESTLESGRQAILLRNRRGYAPLLLCRACGEDFRCAACGLPRTLHRRSARLDCHWCNAQIPVPETCPSCGGGALEPIGSGTERVEEELGKLFPGIRIGVLDRDSARRVGGPATILQSFAAGETRILVGTQMLSKGHHFEGVTLTAVLSADAYLGFPDFRAVERTYALLTQLAGRAGRGESPGRVVLQTYHPEHYAIQAALRHDDEAYVEQEMRFRKMFDYPPFTRMALVLVRDRNRDRGFDRIRDLAARIEGHPGAGSIRLTGPAPAPLERLKGEWRFQLILRSPSGAQIRAAVRGALVGRTEPDLVVDIDPYQLL